MKTNFLILFLSSIVLSSCSNGPELVWQDEFDGDSLDVSKWTAYVGNGCPELCGFGNNEEQYYTDNPANVSVENGVLNISATQDTVGKNPFSSAKLITKGHADWKYGRIEVKAKVPEGRGNWPAIWMLPNENNYGGWPRSGEIDIMEHVGYNPEVVYGTVHTQAFNHMVGTQKGDSIVVNTIDDEFHVYAVDWTEDKIDFYLDEKLYHTFENTGSGNTDEWPFDQPFYLIMNVAVGGGWGGKYGIANDIFPNRMEIDYVRVYQ